MIKVILILALSTTMAYAADTKKPLKIQPVERQVSLLLSQAKKLEKQTEENISNNKTSVEVTKVTSEGYSAFIQSSEFQRLDELEEEYYVDFLADFLDSQGIAGKPLIEMKKALTEVLNTNGEWKVYKLIFADKTNKKFDGALGFLYCLVQNDKKNRLLNFVSIKTSTQFKKFPDLIIIRTTTTENGKITKDDTVIREEEKKMSEEDVDTLLSYFEIVAIKKLAENITPEALKKLRGGSIKFLDGSK